MDEENFQPIQSTTQILEVICHWYGISAAIPQTYHFMEKPVVLLENAGCFLRQPLKLMISKVKLEKIAGWGQQVSKQVANLENKRMSIDDINQHKDLGTGSLRKLVFIQ